MIDEDRTQQIYGYTSKDLSPHSNKKIVIICDECGTYRVIAKTTYTNSVTIEDLCIGCNNRDIRSRRGLSAKKQNVPYSEWIGFIDNTRPHVAPLISCVKINNWFKGAHAHHISPSIIVYIPSELHTHIKHDLTTGENMGEINTIAMQFISGGL